KLPHELKGSLSNCSHALHLDRGAFRIGAGERSTDGDFAYPLPVKRANLVLIAQAVNRAGRSIRDLGYSVVPGERALNLEMGGLDRRVGVEAIVTDLSRSECEVGQAEDQQSERDGQLAKEHAPAPAVPIFVE